MRTLKVFFIICGLLFAFIVFEKVNPIRKYSFPEVLDEGYIVQVAERTFNIDKLDDFVIDCNNKKKSKIKIIIYSSHGDPVIYSLITKGEDILLIEDERRINKTEFRIWKRYETIEKSVNYNKDSNNQEVESIYYFLKSQNNSRLLYTYVPLTKKDYESIY
ncbi:MAG: DUF4362 domain-containing protein [Clostridiales bacterium]|nr:DUF4362 domain-containing protein [Clostridiales bacterium]